MTETADQLIFDWCGINPLNYDAEDVGNLNNWGCRAYDEISSLITRLEAANALLKKINYIAEEQ